MNQRLNNLDQADEWAKKRNSSMPRDDTAGYDRDLTGGNFPSSPFGNGDMATWRMRSGEICHRQKSSL